MPENTLELAENKLLLLYVIKTIKYSITNTQLTDIVLENSFINYFLLQQYITELVSSEFLIYEEENSKKLIRLTEKGDKVLTLFKDRVSSNKIKLIDDYINNKLESIKKELTISGDYTLDNNDTFLVNLKAVEGKTLLLDLKLNVASKKQAISLCSKWRENPSEIYDRIMQAVITD